ncbi:MAG: hypothetical protein II499_05615 [Firmicutes bacterium]|nr:hypothetical protein [Bacillota bacterium]
MVLILAKKIAAVLLSTLMMLPAGTGCGSKEEAGDGMRVIENPKIASSEPAEESTGRKRKSPLRRRTKRRMKRRRSPLIPQRTRKLRQRIQSPLSLKSPRSPRLPNTSP